MFKDLKMIVTLPCSHNYHEECIMTWFDRQHNEINCPQCRMVFKYILIDGKNLNH